MHAGWGIFKPGIFVSNQAYLSRIMHFTFKCFLCRTKVILLASSGSYFETEVENVDPVLARIDLQHIKIVISN